MKVCRKTLVEASGSKWKTCITDAYAVVEAATTQREWAGQMAMNLASDNERQLPMTEQVFVVGMNGSGTTMLLDCLGRHPDLYAFPRETRLIPYLLLKEKKYGDLSADTEFLKLWEEVRHLSVFCQVNEGAAVPLPDNWQQCPRSMAAVLNAIFEYFAAKNHKKRWCEKTPQHVQHLLLLSVAFPNAKFVHMIRDGRDCAASFYRRWNRKPDLTVYRWKKVVTKGRRDGQQLGNERYMEVMYEELTEKPEPVLRAICGFVGVPFDAAILESSQPYMTKTGSKSEGGLKPNSGAWKRCFSAKTKTRLERIAGATLSRCGYPTDCPQSDDDPSALQRKIWAISEIIRQFAVELWEKMTGKINRSWSLILQKPITALRHRGQNDF